MKNIIKGFMTVILPALITTACTVGFILMCLMLPPVFGITMGLIVTILAISIASYIIGKTL